MKFGFSLLIGLVLSVQLFTQTDKRILTIDDLFSIKNVSSPRVSPDGGWVAYTVRSQDLNKDKSETAIWMIDYEGDEAIRMTVKGTSASHPRWSPDGKYLSFLASRGEEKEAKTQVWSLDRRGGEARQITNIKQGVSSFEWSPQSDRLLLHIKDAKPESASKDKKDKPEPYVIDRLQFKRDYAGYLDSRRTHIYTFSPGDTSSIQITSGDFDDSQAVWNPDGISIAFVSNRSDNPDGNSNSNIWIVDSRNTDMGKSLIQLTDNPQEDYSPMWSPDGESLTYVTVTAAKEVMWYATSHLATISVNGGRPKVWTESLDRNVRNPYYFNTDKVRFTLEDSGERHLAQIDIPTGNIIRVLEGAVSVRQIHQHGNITAGLVGRSNHPNEIFIIEDQSMRQLTKVNSNFLDSIQLAKQENIHFKSKDGTEIEGFIYKPHNYQKGKKYPLLLRIHGGPVAQYDCSFRFDPQLFAANGYVVLETNPRGSSGYGQAFSHALFADWGNLDFQDVMAGVDYVIDQGLADESKMGVGGWSYGGILTNYVITQSDRFKGAISGASEALYRSNYGHDHYQRHWETELGLPWENAEAWERISPFNKVANIVTPTLWMGGANDWNVPILNSEQMYQAMKRLGRETQLVVYPNEHHGIRRLSFQKDRLERYLAWYGKYVKEEKPMVKP